MDTVNWAERETEKVFAKAGVNVAQFAGLATLITQALSAEREALARTEANRDRLERLLWRIRDVDKNEDDMRERVKRVRAALCTDILDATCTTTPIITGAEADAQRATDAAVWGIP